MKTGFIHPSLPVLTLGLVLGQLLAPLLRAEFDNDVRLWQTAGIQLYDGANWRVSALAETRLFDEGKFLGEWLLFPNLEYKFHPNLNLGATYLLEDTRAESGADYDRLHIFWLHASPHWQLNDRWSFSMRHVLGLRAVESSENYWMSRHVFALSFKLQNMGRLVALGASTEPFYRYDQDLLFENRFIPIKATFRLSEKSTLSLYYMAQSKRTSLCSSWQTAHVFGQSLNYKW